MPLFPFSSLKIAAAAKAPSTFQTKSFVSSPGKYHFRCSKADPGSASRVEVEDLQTPARGGAPFFFDRVIFKENLRQNFFEIHITFRSWEWIHAQNLLLQTGKPEGHRAICIDLLRIMPQKHGLICTVRTHRRQRGNTPSGDEKGNPQTTGGCVKMKPPGNHRFWSKNSFWGTPFLTQSQVSRVGVVGASSASCFQQRF